MTEEEELKEMEDPRDSGEVEADHIGDNGLDETDDLCDSLLSLFEYVDNVTGCAQEPVSVTVTTEDINETSDKEGKKCSTAIDVNYFENKDVLPANVNGQMNKSLETTDEGPDANMYAAVDKADDVPKAEDKLDILVSNVCCDEHNIVTSPSDNVKVVPVSNGINIAYIDDKVNLSVAAQKADSDSICSASVHVSKNKHEARDKPDFIYLPAQAVNEIFDLENLDKANTHSESVEDCGWSKTDCTLTTADYLPGETVVVETDKEALDKEYTDSQSDEECESSGKGQTVIHIENKNHEFTEQKESVKGQSGETVVEEECTANNIFHLGHHDSFKADFHKDDQHDSKFDHVCSQNAHTYNLINWKKRHLSSSAECPTTPKRLKSIEEAFQGTNTLSPIETAMNFQKDRGIVETFGETPTHCESQDIEKNRMRPISSTPLVQNFGKSKMLSSRKVILKTYHAENKDEMESKTFVDNKNLSTIRNVSKETESTLMYQKVDDHGDVRKVSDELESEPDKTLQEQDKQHDKVSVGRMENEDNLKESKLTDQNNDQNNDNLCVNLPVDSVDILGDCKSTSLSVTDSSYFAQSTSRREGRFKNVEASISKIDLEEDIILSEDVLGLENDYDDSDIDEDTLLAEDLDADDGNKENILSSVHSFKSKDTEEKNENVCKDKKSFKEVKPACEINVKVEKAEKGTCDRYAEQVGPIVEATTNKSKSDLSKQTVHSNICSIDIEISSVTQNLGEHVNQSSEPVVKVQVDIENRKEREIKPSVQIPDAQLENSVKTQDDVCTEKVKTEAKPEVLQDTKPTVCLSKTEANRVAMVQNTTNKKVNSCKTTASTYPVQSLDSSLLVGDTNNNLMKEVKRKWKTDSIPSQDINLTAAITYHQKYSAMNNSCPALLEGEKISCLNFYEEEIHTKHPKINHYSLKEALMKLRNQKEDLDRMKLTAIHAFEQNCIRRSRHLKARHRDEFEQLHRRQCNQFNHMRFRNDIMPFVKQQRLIQLRIDHQKENSRLAHHQRLELESLVREVKSSLLEEIEQHKEQVSPVEKLISQVENMSKLKISNSGKYGPSVMVSFRKRPCKENNWKTSTVEECLPLMIAQALSHEDKLYNHFYKF